MRVVDVSSSPALSKRAFCSGGITAITSATASAAGTSTLKRCLDRATIQVRVSAPPSSAPRDEDAIMLITAVTGNDRKNRRCHLPQCCHMAITKASARGKKTHIWMPNSPELWNQPGPPVAPQSRKPKPVSAHDRAPCCDILKEYSRKASM